MTRHRELRSLRPHLWPSPCTDTHPNRAVVILLTDEMYPADPQVLKKLSDDVAWFSHAGVSGTDDRYRGTDLYNFYEATGGRSTITMDGGCHARPVRSRRRRAAVGRQLGTPPRADRRGRPPRTPGCLQVLAAVGPGVR